MYNAEPGGQAPSGSGPLELIAQAREMAARHGAEDVLLLAAVSESHLLEGAGEHEQAARAARTGTMSADERLLSRSSGSVLAINEAEPLLALGRWDEALQVAGGALNLYLAPTPMHRATLQVLTGTIALARGSLEPAAASLHAARDALRSARQEDQHQLPLARLEIDFALAVDGPAAAVRLRRGSWTGSSCPGAARGTRGRWWRPGRVRCWPRSGRRGRPVTSGCGRTRPGWRNGCGRWRRSSRCSVRCSELAS